MFIPPMNLGQFQPSPATMSQWIYQIWQFLQEHPIATETEIREFIQSELTQSETLANAIEDYLTENPPPAPVQSVQGKTGAVQLAYNDIVTSSNAVPVYKAASAPSTSTLTGQYNLGYRLFVNTTTQEIYTISPAGALSLVGRGKFDGTTVDLNSNEGDTTIAEAVDEIRNASIMDAGTYTMDLDVYGSLTWTKTVMFLNAPFPRVIKSGLNITITSLSITIRDVGGEYLPSSGYNALSELTETVLTPVGLRIGITKAGGGVWSDTVPNNTPLVGTINVKFTLS